MMNMFLGMIEKSFKSAMNTIKVYPVSILLAFAFAVVTMIRIQMDWAEQLDYNYLFNCLHLSFASGAIFGLLAITYENYKFNTKKTFMIANVSGMIMTLIIFILVYNFGGVIRGGNEYITDLAGSRIFVVILISIIGFIYFAGKHVKSNEIAKALFMFVKAFSIAGIYGLVIMSGVSGVAGATRALLYRDLSEKVFMYLGTLSGFLAFTIFVGYFPDFKKGNSDPHREVAESQPRFIRILFEYILIPIILALTVVLILWTIKTTMTGTWPEFPTVAGIVTSYSTLGVILHLMVTDYESQLSKFFRLCYPITSLLILIFGMWSFLIELGKFGLKSEGYFFLIIWILAVVSAILLITKKKKSHVLIAFMISVVALISVMPVVNYDSLPNRVQVARLQKILSDQGILVEGELVPATLEPSLEIREKVTDAVEFLADNENEKLPTWFDETLDNNQTFKEKLGFEKTWPDDEYEFSPNERNEFITNLMLENTVVDIKMYEWAIFIDKMSRDSDGNTQIEIDGKRGVYVIEWQINSRTNIPSLTVYRDDKVIIEQDFQGFLDDKVEAFKDNSQYPNEVSYQDLSLKLEAVDIEILLIFDEIFISLNPRNDRSDYYMNLNTIYFKEN